MDTYTLRDIQSMLGISKSVISRLMALGFVSPVRGKRREYRFTFQEIVLLRMAYSLRSANISTRKIFRSLKRLKDTLPSELPLTGLRITAVGNEVAVKEADTQWQIESGQLLIDFEVKPSGSNVKFLTRTPEPDTDEASHWFDVGNLLEADDRAEAEAAYRQAVKKAPDYVDAYLNLGCILCDAGRHEEAADLYRKALRHCPNEAFLYFNLAIALEDLKRTEEALACYEICMRLSPEFADAHYNAARLHEMFGHSRKAIRHYSEYRRLQTMDSE
jgi:tetratricopeptide (TPR) repeat protein